MADPIATYRSWSHVGIPGFDPVDLGGADGSVDAEYLKGCFFTRSGRPGRFEGESARFEGWLTGRVALQADGTPAKKDLRATFDVVEVMPLSMAEVVVSNGWLWGAVRTGHDTPWGNIRRTRIVAFRFRLADVDFVSLGVGRGLRGDKEQPLRVESLVPAGSLELEVTAQVDAASGKTTKHKSARALFEATVAAAAARRLEKATDDETRRYLEEVAAGRHRERTDEKEEEVDLNHPDHAIQLDEHGQRTDRPHWPRPSAD